MIYLIISNKRLIRKTHVRKNAQPLKAYIVFKPPLLCNGYLETNACVPPELHAQNVTR